MLNATSAGETTLSFKGVPMIQGACPSLVIPSLRDQRVSMCDPLQYKGASLGPASRGPDFIEHQLSYHPLTSSQAPTVISVFRAFDAPATTIHVLLQLPVAITTNLISPLTGGKWSIGGTAENARILHVPQDNDLQSMYATVAADKRSKIGTSSFVTAIYNDSKTAMHGMVLGFLNHTHWKSGIEYTESTVSAVAGLNGELLTRDKVGAAVCTLVRTHTQSSILLHLCMARFPATLRSCFTYILDTPAHSCPYLSPVCPLQEPHGMVSTDVGPCPVLMIGAYADWRDGMEEYAQQVDQPAPLPHTLPHYVPHTLHPTLHPALGLAEANGEAGHTDNSTAEPVVDSPQKVEHPLAGWNSWAMAAGGIGQPNETNMFAAADVLADIRAHGFGPDQFVTRDAIYGLDINQTKKWVDHVKTHAGQQVGCMLDQMYVGS
jgi:hypothetical protein